MIYNLKSKKCIRVQFFKHLRKFEKIRVIIFLYRHSIIIPIIIVILLLLKKKLKSQKSFLPNNFILNRNYAELYSAPISSKFNQNKFRCDTVLICLWNLVKLFKWLPFVLYSVETIKIVFDVLVIPYQREFLLQFFIKNSY